MAASGNTIGEVNVKVTPNVLGFAQDAKTKIEAQLAGTEFDAPVTAEAKTAQAEAELAALAKPRTAKIDAQVNQDRWVRDIRANLEKVLNDANARLTPTLEDEKLRREIADIEKDFKGLLGQFDPNIDPVKVAIDREFFEAELAGIEQDLANQFSNRRINLEAPKWSSDAVREAQAELKKMTDANERQSAFKLDQEKLDNINDAFLRQVELTKARTEDIFRKLKIKIEPDPQITRFAIARAQIGMLFAKPIKVAINPDGNLIQRGLAKVAGVVSGSMGALGKVAVSGLSAGFEGVTKAVGGLFSALTAFGPLITAVIALIAILLPPVLALGAGLAVLAPGFAALAVPIGAVMLGLEGIKKAAETVKPEFEALKKVMSDTFEKGFTEQFARLKGEGGFFSALTEEMPKVAAGLNSMLAGVVDSLSSEQGIGKMRSIIDNVSEGLERAKGGMKGFTDGFLTLIAGISEKFPGIGDWFTELGNKFARNMTEWTTIEDENGFTKLERLIQNVRTGIEGLTGVFQAFWNQGLKDIDSPTFGEGMKQFFNAVRAFVTDTLPALSEGFKSIASLMDKLSPLFRLIGLGGNIFGALTSNPATTWKELEARVNDAYAKGGNWKDALLAGLTENGMPTDQLFNNVPAEATKAGQQAGEKLVSSSAQAIADAAKNGPITPEQLLKAIADEEAARAAGVKAGEAVNAGVDQGLQTRASQGLDEPAAAPKPEVAPGLSENVKAAVEQAKRDIITIGPVLNQAVADAMVPLQQIPAILATQMAGITQTITTVFSSIPAIISTASVGVVQVITSTFTGVVQIVGTTLGALPQIAARGFNGMATTAATACTQLVQSVTTAGTQVVTEVGTWTERLKAPFSGLAAAFQTFGTQIGQGLAAGIRASAPAAIAEAKFMAAQVAAASKSALDINSPSKVFRGIGESVGEGFEEGIGNGQAGVVSQMEQMLTAVKNVFGDTNGLTLNFNMGPITQQLGAATSSVNSFQSSLSSTAKTATGYNDALSSTVTPDTKAQSDELGRQLALLEMQRKQIQLDRDAGKLSKEAAKAELDKINNQKTQLGLQKNQLDYAMKYGEQTEATGSKMDEFYKDIGKKVVQFPQDIAKTVGSEFMSDLGMSGSGAIPNLLEQGANYIFQVMDMDSAIAGQQVVQNKQAQQYTRR